jgi:hypothetical protein
MKNVLKIVAVFLLIISSISKNCIAQNESLRFEQLGLEEGFRTII